MDLREVGLYLASVADQTLPPPAPRPPPSPTPSPGDAAIGNQAGQLAAKLGTPTDSGLGTTDHGSSFW